MTVLNKILLSDVMTRTGLDKYRVHKALVGLFSSIAEALGKGDEVSVPDFGRFVVKQRSESQGRNPRTGLPITIAARKQVVFKPYPGLKDAVNPDSKTASISLSQKPPAQKK